MVVEIKELSSKRLDDFLFFFDNVAFTDNPEWASCYCFFFHFSGSADEWTARKREENRDAAIRFIDEGRMRGYLAYSGGSPVGWCNVNGKNRFPALLRDDALTTGYDDSIASIVCFLVAPESRRKGVSRALLRRAREDYEGKKYQYLEAYPRTGAHSAAEHYRGPLSLYLRHGFEVWKETKDCKIVRKRLAGPV